MNLVEKFWSKVSVEGENDCWEWNGIKNRQKYGIVVLSRSAGKTRNVLAHRFAYEMANGQIKDKDICVCHRCDNPSCVNQRHLFLGTRADNHADMVQKGRHFVPDSVGESNGKARLSVEEVLKIRSSPLPHFVLAGIFGVKPAAISKIKTRRTWDHV